MEQFPLIQKQTSSCDQCDGSGYIVLDNSISPCNCILNSKRDEYIRRIIPQRYQGQRLQSLMPSDRSTISPARQQRVIDLLKQSPLDGYIFLGPTGVGKSHLLYTLAIEAVYNSGRVIVTTCADLVKSTKEAELGKGEDPIDINELLDSAITSYIFIDELDKVKLTEYSQLFLFNLVNVIYDNPDKIKLSITSNLPPNKFEEVYGPAFVRKLRSISKFISYSGE